MGELIFKQHAADGRLGWRAFAGDAYLGAIFNVRRDGPGMSWIGEAPDGTRFSALTRAGILQKLRGHAAAPRVRRYKVFVTQMVERVAEVEVEAIDAVAARDLVLADPASIPEAAWVDGDEMDDCDVYAVRDDAGDLAWERA